MRSPTGSSCLVWPPFRLAIRLASALGLVLMVWGAETAGQPGGAAQMSGIPLPAADLPPGTVTVRVVRGDISNNLRDQVVELHGGPTVLTAKTDENGRAQFSGLASGTRVHAVSVVDDSRLTSETFAVPATGGVRILLVAPAATGSGGSSAGRGSAGAGAAGGADAGPATPVPAAPGTLRLGRETQFVVELNDDELEVFYLLQIVNPSSTPVEHPPLVFDLPPGARNATLLEGSSPLASVAGPRLTVSGPFPAGVTTVQAAYQLPYSDPEITVAQRLPVALDAVAIVAEKVGAVHLTSPQMSNHGEMPAEGKVYLVATGPGVRAGESLSFTLTGLPVHARWPRVVALGLALGILAAGVWASVAAGEAAGRYARRRQALQQRRERLFGDLVNLEEAYRAGRVDASRYERRRRELVAELARVYGELDEGVAA